MTAYWTATERSPRRSRGPRRCVLFLSSFVRVASCCVARAHGCLSRPMCILLAFSSSPWHPLYNPFISFYFAGLSPCLALTSCRTLRTSVCVTVYVCCLLLIPCVIGFFVFASCCCSPMMQDTPALGITAPYRLFVWTPKACSLSSGAGFGLLVSADRSELVLCRRDSRP